MPKKDIMWDIFESIDQSDLQALISAEKAESRDLEYKREFPGKADGDKIPFLAQISAFANTVGGRLLIGMEAEKGVAKECLGIDIDNPDQPGTYLSGKPDALCLASRKSEAAPVER